MPEAARVGCPRCAGRGRFAAGKHTPVDNPPRAGVVGHPSVTIQGSGGHPEMVVVKSGLPKGETWNEEESEVFVVKADT